MAEVIAIKNPTAQLLPDLAELFRVAFATVRIPAVYQRFLEAIGQPYHDVLALREGDRWVGLAWINHSDREDEGISTVLHFYAKGGVKCREALIKAVVEAAKESGSDKLHAWDMNNKPRAFPRIFRSAGPVRETIRAYEFDLSEARY